MASSSLHAFAVSECEIPVAFEMPHPHHKKKRRRKQKLNASLKNYRTFDDPPESAPDEPDSHRPFLVRLCLSVLSVDVARCGMYLLGAAVLGLVGDTDAVGDNRHLIYTATPHNVLNDYFVKFAWGWNLTLAGPLAALCCIATERPLVELLRALVS